MRQRDLYGHCATPRRSYAHVFNSPVGLIKCRPDELSVEDTPVMRISIRLVVLPLLLSAVFPACHKDQAEQPHIRRLTFAKDVEPILKNQR
jgi:hypothetical protein